MSSVSSVEVVYLRETKKYINAFEIYKKKFAIYSWEICFQRHLVHFISLVKKIVRRNNNSRRPDIEDKYAGNTLERFEQRFS